MALRQSGRAIDWAPTMPSNINRIFHALRRHFPAARRRELKDIAVRMDRKYPSFWRYDGETGVDRAPWLDHPYLTVPRPIAKANDTAALPPD